MVILQRPVRVAHRPHHRPIRRAVVMSKHDAWAAVVSTFGLVHGPAVDHLAQYLVITFVCAYSPEPPQAKASSATAHGIGSFTRISLGGSLVITPLAALVEGHLHNAVARRLVLVIRGPAVPAKRAVAGMVWSAVAEENGAVVLAA